MKLCDNELEQIKSNVKNMTIININLSKSYDETPYPVKSKKAKKCHYNNRGFCKYKKNAKIIIPTRFVKTTKGMEND